MANEDVDVEALRRLVYEFEEGPVWAHVKAEMEKVYEEDLRVLINGTGDAGKDDVIRGGIAATKDHLAIPDRLKQQLVELLEEEEPDGERG